MWLREQKVNLRNITMLTGSRYVEITAGFVRRFAELESIMRVYTEPLAFDEALAKAFGPVSEKLQ
jgi:phage regulator Rha-like protein